MTLPLRKTRASGDTHATPSAPTDAAHPVAWAFWLLVVLGWLLLTRNPLYLLLVWLCIAVVEANLPPRGAALALPFSPWRLALVIVPVTALFNALLAPYGSTVLFRWPERLPFLEGAVTSEALLFGTLNGMVLVGMIAAFAVLTRALPTHALIRLAPRAFHPLAITTAVALIFVPSTLRHVQQVREAQAVRGHRLKGLRDWLPLFVPLLVGGLERALELAEAMTARGFASQSEPISHRDRALLVLALFTVLVGVLGYAGWQARWGALLALAGGAATLLLTWAIGRRVRHTSYRIYRWGRVDVGVVALLLIAIVPLLPLPFLDRTSLFFYPYPALRWPGFEPGIAAALLGLLAPVLWSASHD